MSDWDEFLKAYQDWKTAESGYWHQMDEIIANKKTVELSNIRQLAEKMHEAQVAFLAKATPFMR